MLRMWNTVPIWHFINQNLTNSNYSTFNTISLSWLCILNCILYNYSCWNCPHFAIKLRHCMYYTKSYFKLQVSLQFSDQDASQGWPRAMVSREQHVQDDPHTGNGQERLPAWPRSTFLEMKICKKKNQVILLPEHWTSFPSSGWIQSLSKGHGKSGTACPGWSSHWKWPRKAPNLIKKWLSFSKICKKNPGHSTIWDLEVFSALIR